MNKRNIILFFTIFVSCTSLSSKTDVGAMFKSMFEGMGQVESAPGYVYNYEVWSDASVPIYIEHQGMASFMGAIFPNKKGMFGGKTLPPVFDAEGGLSKAVYSKQVYYFRMYISDNKNVVKHPIYKQSFTHLPLEKNDKKVFYYHVYTSKGFKKGNVFHKPAVENMGYQDPTQLNSQDKEKQGNVKFSPQLSEINFYNSSGSDVQISLTYGTTPYTFTAEKYSCNFLGLPTKEEKKDDKKTDDKAVDLPLFSLRPNIITFSVYNAATQGYDQFRSLTLSDTGFEGASYTIEIFQDPGKKIEVGIQGFNPGNYDIGATPRDRDVTPCPCSFWYQSFAQAGSVAGYSDLPGQVWIVYGGKDSPIVSKVIPGQVLSWNLTRPLISQADQFVYFVYVVTNDDVVAQNFVQKFAAQMIGKNISDEYSKAAQKAVDLYASTQKSLDISGDVQAVEETLTSDQQVAALMGSLNIANGMIEDTEQSVIGYLVGADVFTPKGLGFGRFYYTLSPSVINFNGVVSLVFSCLDTAKTKTLGGSDVDVQKSITQTVNDWFAVYIKKPADAQALVQKYLIQFGNAKIVDAKSGALTKFGQSRLQAIVSGNLSLKFPSMKLSTVTNQYVYDFGKAAPDKMPNALKNINMIFTSNVQEKKKPAKPTVKQRIVAPLISPLSTAGYLAAEAVVDAATDKKS